MARIEGQSPAVPPRAAADAVSALVNLGYGQVQAGAAVSVAIKAAGHEAGAERLIRLALRELAAS
jgi:Holliday junction DNA helicase RuvA